MKAPRLRVIKIDPSCKYVIVLEEDKWDQEAIARLVDGLEDWYKSPGKPFALVTGVRLVRVRPPAKVRKPSSASSSRRSSSGLAPRGKRKGRTRR